MNVERGIGRHRVGGWEFLPATGELRRRTDVRRLEPRAAKTLELLCEANGDIVSQEQLIAGVWSGRSLSDNSVAVVIGQLRRALDDDAREPKLIETIPKRGYRLCREATAPEGQSAQRNRLLIIAGAVLAIIAGWAAHSMVSKPGVAVLVTDVSNETGNPAYGPLARATSELVVTELADRGFAVRRDGGGDLLLASKLVMWDSMPFLGMSATDRTGVVRWSAMIKATPGQVPPGVDKALDELAAGFPPKEGPARVANEQAAR
jgi:DNA-binding winged helix-turn-helix (wHTH) protein